MFSEQIRHTVENGLEKREENYGKWLPAQTVICDCSRQHVVLKSHVGTHGWRLCLICEIGRELD